MDQRIKDIYCLRRTKDPNDLKEAWQQVTTMRDEDPYDDDTLFAYAWVAIDLCRLNAQEHNRDEALNYYNILSGLNIPDDDTFASSILNSIGKLRPLVDPYYEIVLRAETDSKNGNVNDALNTLHNLQQQGRLSNIHHETYGWVIFRYLKANDNLDSHSIRSWMNEYMQLSNDRPSMLHSNFLNFALNLAKKDDNFRFVNFLYLWGINNLRHEDFRDGYSLEGSIPSLFLRIARVCVDRGWNVDIDRIASESGEDKSFILDFFRKAFFFKANTIFKEDKSALWAIFDQYLENFSGPASEWHSKMLSLALRAMTNNEAWRLPYFIFSWGISFRKEDWKVENSANGDVYPPLAPRAIKSAFEALKQDHEYDTNVLEMIKHLLDEAISNQEMFLRSDEHCSNFLKLERLDRILKIIDARLNNCLTDDKEVVAQKESTNNSIKETHETLNKEEQELLWLKRDKGLLLSMMGNKQGALDIYKVLIKELCDKYYIWQEYASLIDDPETKVSLLSKALLLEKQEDFVGNIRLNLATALISIDKKKEAAIELTQYEKHRENKGWNLPKIFVDLKNVVSDIAAGNTNNEKFYKQYAPKGEEYAYGDGECVECVVLDKWAVGGKGNKCLISNVEDLEVKVDVNKFPILRNIQIGKSLQLYVYKKYICTNPISWRIAEMGYTKIIPLLIKESNKEDWFCLPLKTGYIVHINEEKKIAHIISSDSEQAIYSYTNEFGLVKKDFVKYNQYFTTNVDDNTKKYYAVNICKCDPAEAIPMFNHSIAVVDDINVEKHLFHYSLGPNKLSGVVFFADTDIHPNIGDFIIAYNCIDIDKEGKKRLITVNVEITDQTSPSLKKTISGHLSIKSKTRYCSGRDFAFIDDYYVHLSILNKFNIYRDCDVTADVVIDGDGKWRVYNIYNIHNLDESDDSED